MFGDRNACFYIYDHHLYNKYISLYICGGDGNDVRWGSLKCIFFHIFSSSNRQSVVMRCLCMYESVHALENVTLGASRRICGGKGGVEEQRTSVRCDECALCTIRE